jgi:hypothetical protein
MNGLNEYMDTPELRYERGVSDFSLSPVSVDDATLARGLEQTTFRASDLKYAVTLRPASSMKCPLESVAMNAAGKRGCCKRERCDDCGERAVQNASDLLVAVRR